MSKFIGEKSYFHGKSETMGVLLVNLGTPDAPTRSALRRYLKEFLSDPRVVEIPALIWYPILYGVILTKRPAKSAALYQKIWQEEGSPLLINSQKQQQALQQEMKRCFKGDVRVVLGMRYGHPSIQSALEKLKQKNVRRLLVLPLYPQYSATTTATTYDAVYKELQQWRWIPELRLIGQYHDNDYYINALANSVKQHWRNPENQKGEKLIFSFHGLPKRNLILGDPYFCQCHKTARLLADKLSLRENQWQVTFQSRFGKAEWLQPYTDKTLQTLAKEGIKKVNVICPGFAADCLETLEEINMQNRDFFIQAGGEYFSYIPALNDDKRHIQALTDVIQQHSQGWQETKPDFDVASQQKKSQLSVKYAKKQGADG